MGDLKFFNPWDKIDYSFNRLPHWQQAGVTYFVTWRLKDSLPQENLNTLRIEKSAWLQEHPQPWSNAEEVAFHRRFTGQVDRWLDAGMGACVLKDKTCARLVANSLHYFEGKRTAIISFVVMPNHVHVLFAVAQAEPLGCLIKSWKSNSARAINKLRGETGSLWQKDYFDRLIRDSEHFARCVRYIRYNPEKAKLKSGEFLLFESQVAQGIQQGL